MKYVEMLTADHSVAVPGAMKNRIVTEVEAGFSALLSCLVT